MSELFGPLPRHAITGVPLVLAVLAPLAAAATVAVIGPWLDQRPGLRRLAPRAGARTASDLVVALSGIVSAIIVATGIVFAVRSPSGLVVSPAWVLARTGSIEATLGFDADVGRGALALVVALGGAAVALRGSRVASPVGPYAAPHATWRAIAIAAGVAALLADGFATALLAFGGALLATGAGSIRGRWAPGGAAVAALLLSALTLAWGLEGRWLDGLSGNYISDYGPRFAAVRDAPPQAARPRGPVAQAKGSITMTSASGSDVYVGVADDASIRSRTAPFATSPFVAVPVAASLQKIAVVPGGAAIVGGEGLEIALCDNIDIRGGDDVVVTPLGASWTWRDVEAQFLLRDAEGKHPMRSGFAAKPIGPAYVPTVVLLLAFLAAVLAWLDGPRRVARAIATHGRLDGGLVATVLALATVAPAARLASLVPLSSAVPLLILAGLLVAFGALVVSSRGGWLSAGVAVLATGGALVAVAADAPPVVALAVALLAGFGARFAESEVGRPPSPWIAGTEEDDPIVPAAAAVAAPLPELPPGAAAEPIQTKKKKAKKNVETRS